MAGYVPDFENPYPNGEWSEITEFEYKDPLILRRNVRELVFRHDRKKDAMYLVAEDYTVRYRLDGEDEDRFIAVPAGTLTDLATVQRLARLIIGRVGPHLEASIVHDFLYIAWQDIDGRGARREDWKFANKLMREAMKKAKVGWFRRILIYAAVSSFVGWRVYEEPNQDRYREPPDFE